MDLQEELEVTNLEDYFDAELEEGQQVNGFTLIEHDIDVVIVGKGNRFFQIDRYQECSYGDTWWSYPSDVFEVEPIRRVLVQKLWRRKSN